ncbi:MAG: DUF6262 family protein [Clostridiaceae bacterium]
MPNSNPNTSKMIEHAKLKTEKCYTKFNAAISTMTKENVPINFNTVSSYAGISKRFLYTHEEIRNTIMQLRNQQYIPNTYKSKQKMTDSSKDVIINSQKLKIESLQQESLKLKEELKILYGKLAFSQIK